MSEPKLPKAWRDLHRLSTTPAPGRRDCPDADALALLAVDPGSAAADDLDHVARCSACSQELLNVMDDGSLAALTAELAADSNSESGADAAASPVQRTLGRKAVGGLALAATLVIAVAVSVLMPLPEDAPTFRSGPGIEGLMPPSGARLDQAPRRFEWPGSGRSEQVILMDARADTIWTAPVVRDGMVEVPEALRKQLVEGRYYWQVRDLDHDSLLGPFEFRLMAP